MKKSLNKEKINKFKRIASTDNAWIFAPGLFFVLMAVVTLLAPGLLIAVLAGLFMFIGVSFCVVAWKVRQLKRKAEQFTQQFQGRVFVHGLNVQENPQQEFYKEEKKIILH